MASSYWQAVDVLLFSKIFDLAQILLGVIVFHQISNEPMKHILTAVQIIITVVPSQIGVFSCQVMGNNALDYKCHL